jgi:hypothetical protein
MHSPVFANLPQLMVGDELSESEFEWMMIMVDTVNSKLSCCWDGLNRKWKKGL